MKRILFSMVTVTTFASVLLSANAADKLPKLLDLGAGKCIPCKKMAPILEELKKEYEGTLDVEFIDVWQKKNAEKAERFGIKLIPTQIFVDASGKELWRHEGFISKEDILGKWKELGVDLHADKMKLPPGQIEKACRIGECSPK